MMVNTGVLVELERTSLHKEKHWMPLNNVKEAVEVHLAKK